MTKKKTHRSKVPGQEHLVLDEDNRIVGLYCLDVDNLDGVDSWAAVDQAIKEYAVIHPNEITMVIAENADIRKANYNKFGSGKSQSMRHGVSIPPALMFKLERVMPDIFTNPKKLHHFMEKYKGFRTCDAI